MCDEEIMSLWGVFGWVIGIFLLYSNVIEV